MKKNFILFLLIVAFVFLSIEISARDTTKDIPVPGSSISRLNLDPSVYKEMKLGNFYAYIERNIFDSYKYYFLAPYPNGSITLYMSNAPFHIQSINDIAYFVNEEPLVMYEGYYSGRVLERHIFPVTQFINVHNINSKGKPINSAEVDYNNIIKHKGWSSNFRMDVVENVSSFLGKYTYDIVVKGFFPHSSSIAQGLEVAPVQLGGSLRYLVQAMLPHLLVITAIMVCLISLRVFFKSLDDGLEDCSTDLELD